MILTGLTVAVFALTLAAAEAQPESPDLELEGYRIIGKDTRVFTITGDRYSTVDFVRAPVVVPREERDMEASKGLIGEDERIHRKEDFTVQHGFYSRLDALSGLNTPLVLWGKASLDGGPAAGTLRLINRTAKENTPTNAAPLIQDVDAAGYYDTSIARFAVDGMYGREDDDINGKFFRNRLRTVGRYGGGLAVNLTSLETWDVSGRFSFNGANYEDNELPYDDGESRMTGSAVAAGAFGRTTVVIDATGSYLKFAGDHGTVTTLNGLGEWLLFGSLGLKAGVSVGAFKAPGDNETKFHTHPRAAADWAITPNLYMKVSYSPGVISHSFSDLYGMNGLVQYSVPMLFEDRSVDVDGELGLRLSSSLKIALGAFYIESEDMPLFSADSTAVFYEVLTGSDIKLNGMRMKVSYNRPDRLAVDGGITIHNTSWNFTEKAPYIPDMEASVTGAMTFYRLWLLRGAASYYGKHYIARGSGDREDGFTTIDVGVERKIRGKHLSLYVDLRNMTNSRGSWWSSRYKIPGAGLYAGLKAEY